MSCLGARRSKPGCVAVIATPSLDGEPVRLGGDVVITIDSRPVKTFDDLLAYLARSTEVGQTVTLTILRQDQEDCPQGDAEPLGRKHSVVEPPAVVRVMPGWVL
jgi:S1-C subfamily serine protease